MHDQTSLRLNTCTDQSRLLLPHICSQEVCTVTTDGCWLAQAVSAADVRTFGVLGTSFNPDQGSVVDLGRISPNLEVCDGLGWAGLGCA